MVTAGVCAWLVACGSSSHKKVLTCDAAECGPDEDADVPDAAAAGAPSFEPEPEPAAGQGGEGGSAPEPEPEPDAGLPEGGAGGSTAEEFDLQLVIVGDGSVAVGDAGACLTSSCTYPTSPDTSFALLAKPGSSSRFVGWSGDCSGTQPNTSIKVTGPTQCVATFVAQRAVALTVSANGGGNVISTPDLSCGANGCQGEVDDHSHVTMLATPLTGFLFAGWSGSPECNGSASASLDIEVTQDVSCVAKFVKQYVLTIAAQGATASVSVSTGTCKAILCAADAGSSASFQAGAVTGFRFTNWSGDTQCTGTTNPLLIASVGSDISCVANYAARYSATGLVNGGVGAVVASSANVNAVCSGNSCTLDSGTTATLLAPTIAGSRLTGWSGTGCLPGNQSGNGITVTPTTGNITCTANYALGVSVTGTVVGATGTVIAASISSGASCGPGACGIDSGGSVTLTAPNLLPGYRFSGWTGDAGCAGAGLAVTLSNVTSSKACSANYVQQFTIASQANTGGTSNAKNGALVCAGNSCTVDAGTAVTLTAVPDVASGFHFTTWSGPGCTPAAVNPLLLSNLNTTCVANFALNTFTIAGTAGTNGSVTATRGDTGALCVGGSCTVNFGVNVSLAAVPAPNYHFASWSGAGCTPTGGSPLVLKNLNANCTAAFAINTFAASVSASPPAGGAVAMMCPSGNCGAVPYGQFVNFTAVASAGWSLQSWSANCGGGTASPNAVTITGNTACVANFRPIVTGVVAPSGAGAITASGTPNAVCLNGSPASCAVDLNGSVTLVAKAASNAVFTGWTGDCTGAAATFTLTAVTVPKNCTANFYQLWAQATGADGDDRMTNVTSLGDGTVVGFGVSAAKGAKVNRATLVDLDANTGKAIRAQLFEDSAKTGNFAALGLTTTANQKNVIALGVHAVPNLSTQPWLHNEQAPKWESEYSYSNGGPTTAGGGEVITTLDGGYAFSVAVVDPKATVAMAHLTHVDASGKPTFDAQFCAPAPVGAAAACSPTVPVDLLQDPATKNYVVLSQVLNGTLRHILLTFINEAGTILGSTRYVDGQDLVASQFVPGSVADSYLVVGSVTDSKGSNTNAFFAELTRAAKPPSFAFSIGSANVEQLTSVTRTASGYALAGLLADPTLANEAWLLFVDTAGGIKTQLAYGGPQGDWLNAISPLPAGGFALAGVTSSWGAGANDLWALRVDPNGALTFNAASGAKRYTTAFAATAITGITSPATAVVKSDSVATQVAAAVTASLPSFTQVAQAP